MLLQGTPNLLDAPDLQDDRWRRTLKRWLKATRNSKSVVIGDFNLDYSQWFNPTNNLRMIERTKVEIETVGFVQMVQNITRSWPGQADSLVDHLWTNDPERIINCSNIVRAGLDHNFISALKDRVIMKNYIRTRCWKKMNIENVKEMAKSLQWDELLLSNDINIINDIMTKNILFILERKKKHQ